MASYAGGAHTADVVATDFAGNKAARKWTINVDPTGAVSTPEAVRTVEAVEGTTSQAWALEAASPEEMAMGEKSVPGLAAEGVASYSSTGTPASSTVKTAEGEKLTIKTPYGPISLAPTDGATGDAGTTVSEVAAVSSDTSANTDSVVRAKYNGLLDFQVIRDASAEEKFSWEVSLLSGENLTALPGGSQAAVYFEGTIEMMLIEAMPAHDALGHSVPTSLSVTAPNIVTLTVKHRSGGYVYPVLAGPGFEVGWSRVEVIKPPPTAKQGIEREFEGYEELSAPVPSTAVEAGATASSAGGPWKEEFFKKVLCSHAAKFATVGYHLLPPTAPRSAFEEHCGDPWRGGNGVLVAFREGLHGRFFQRAPHNPTYAEVRHPGGSTESIGCVAEANPGNGVSESLRRAGKETCGWWGPTRDGGGPSAVWGKHITPVSFNYGESRGSCGDNCGGPNPWERIEMPGMVFYLWADGHYAFHETRCIDCG